MYTISNGNNHENELNMTINLKVIITERYLSEPHGYPFNHEGRHTLTKIARLSLTKHNI